MVVVGALHRHRRSRQRFCGSPEAATVPRESRAQRHALAARLDGADAQYRIQFLWKLSMPMPVFDLGVGCQARLALPLQETSASPVVLPTSGPTGSGPSAGFGFAYGSGLPTPLDSGSSDLFPSDSIGLSQRRETVRNEFSPEAGAELL